MSTDTAYSRKIFTEESHGQGNKWRRNIAENFNRLSRMHERYRRQTDGRTTTYSERELVNVSSRSLKPKYRYSIMTTNILLTSLLCMIFYDTNEVECKQDVILYYNIIL